MTLQHNRKGRAVSTCPPIAGHGRAERAFGLNARALRTAAGYAILRLRALRNPGSESARMPVRLITATAAKQILSTSQMEMTQSERSNCSCQRHDIRQRRTQSQRPRARRKKNRKEQTEQNDCADLG